MPCGADGSLGALDDLEVALMSGPLTEAGEATVAELAARYRVSDGAVRALLDAVVRGRGSMAQFSHPDLGGSGQWMRGGMTMVGDMFNPGLQSTVSGICTELSSRLATGAVLVTVPDRGTGGGVGTSGGDWWPPELGRPSSSGGQNDDSYAYFPGPRRLAVRRGSTVTVYDTGDHAISGVQQQQGSRGSKEFSSQFGTFTVDSLTVVGAAPPEPRRGAPTAPEPSAAAPAAPAPAATTPAPSTQASSTQAPATSGPSTPPPSPSPSTPPPSTPPANRPFTAPTIATDLPAEPPQPPALHPAPAWPVLTPPAPSAPTGGASTPAEIGAAIETLAGLRDKGFLTDEEFTAKKTELLARL
jgi:hypothetical protein